jgi:hypothetical protein
MLAWAALQLIGAAAFKHEYYRGCCERIAPPTMPGPYDVPEGCKQAWEGQCLVWQRGWWDKH